MKKIISLMLSVTMLLPICGGSSISHAEETPAGEGISSVSEFLAMDPGGVYYLTEDIDFSGTAYQKNVYTKSFQGVLDGNGHSLLGITVQATNSDAGIFANSFGGTLKNLTVGSESAPVSITSTGEGYSVAAIAGTVVSGARFEKIKIYANIKGDGKTAGFTSYMPNGNLAIDSCKVYGSVSGNPASGYVCMSHDGSSDITITNSENYASVTGKNLGAGGFYATHAMVNGSRVCHLKISGCANYGAITASDWRVGGLVGEFNESLSSSLSVKYSYNVGAVTMTGGGGFAAGIVGGMCFDPPSGERSLYAVYNAGLVRNTENNTRAYSIAFAHTGNDKVKIENAAYLDGVSSENCNESNVQRASDKEALLFVVSQFPSDENGLSFVADTGNINDGYPILSVQNSNHTNVHTYNCGRIVCLDCNTVLSLPEDENHSYTESVIAPEGYLDGYVTSVCSECANTVKTADQPNQWSVKPEEGVYTLSSPENLMWYASNVNAGLLSGNESLCLGADLDMSSFEFEPIKAGNKGFTGKLDGACHTISNLRVDSKAEGGLFEKLGMGAQVSNLNLTKINVKAEGAAGALAGSVASGAVVRLENIALTDSSVSSEKGAAGGLVGSSEGAADVNIFCAVCDTVDVSGNVAGGILGNGNNARLNNVYALAKLTAGSGKTGALATHTTLFSQKNSGYSKSTSATQKDGISYDDSAFSSGEIAYLINTYSRGSLFGKVDGRNALSDAPMKLVRLGSRKIYTDNILSSKEGTAVYVINGTDKMTLVIVQNGKSGGKWLVDSEITCNGEKITFNSLKLSKYVNEGDTYYVAQDGSVLYTLALDKAESVKVTVGNSFSADAEVLKTSK